MLGADAEAGAQEAMRTIIAGSRTVRDPACVVEAVRASGIEPSVVLSGGARGADRLGAAWALVRQIPVEIYPADWEKHGKGAGVIRNQQMAEKAEALIAVWDGNSRGTQDMIKRALNRGLVVYVHDLSAA